MDGTSFEASTAEINDFDVGTLLTDEQYVLGFEITVYDAHIFTVT